MGRLAPKSHLAAVRPATHGGLNHAELRQLGISPEDVLDFSVNTNPVPIPAELRQVITSANVATYPDSACRGLREAVAIAYGVTPEQVLAGNGSSELIWLVGSAYVEAGDTVLVRQPTFGEYEAAARVQGAVVATYADTFESALRTHAPKAMFVCNPNNPTGDQLQPNEVVQLARRYPATLFVVDEAYADFVDGRPTAISPDMPDNFLVLRSLTKFAALAGLRLGLAFGQPVVIEALTKVKPPWNVNAAAQAAGEYALGHPELLPDLDNLASARSGLIDGLRRLGLRPLPTSCNFFLVPVKGAYDLRARLLVAGCLVRDCTSFGLPDHIRIAVRTPEDNLRLVQALEAAL
jgi:histidinol-phosphate aminotransferase